MKRAGLVVILCVIMGGYAFMQIRLGIERHVSSVTVWLAVVAGLLLSLVRVAIDVGIAALVCRFGHWKLSPRGIFVPALAARVALIGIDTLVGSKWGAALASGVRYEIYSVGLIVVYCVAFGAAMRWRGGANARASIVVSALLVVLREGVGIATGVRIL